MKHWTVAVLVTFVFAVTPSHGHAGALMDVARLTSELSRSPSAALYLQRAQAQFWLSRHSEALEDLNRAEAMGAAAQDVALGRAQVHGARGEDALAKVELQAYFKAGGGALVALRQEARLLAQSGQLEPAAWAYERALAVSHAPDLCLEASALHEKVGRGEEAARVLERCLGDFEGACVLRRRLVEVRLRQSEFGRALEQVRLAQQGLAVKAEWTLLAAQVFEAWGKQPEAKAERRAALAELDLALAGRGSGYQQLLRAEALAGLNREREALEALEGLLRVKPDFKEASALRETVVARRSKRTRP